MSSRAFNIADHMKNLQGTRTLASGAKIVGADADSIQAPGLITSAGGGDNTSLNTGLASATFFAGHIIQSIYNPTIASNSTAHISEGVAASVTGQITITSGNGVLIYVQAGYVYLDRNSGDMGYTARIREGLTTSGTELSAVVERHTSHPSNWTTNFSLWGYDSSPADTTPDYCLTLTTSPSGGGAHYVRLESGYTSSTYLKFFLFEVKQ